MATPVITGIGMVCSLGATRQAVWRRLLAGSPRMGPIRAFDASAYGLDDCIAAEIDDGELAAQVALLRQRGFEPSKAGRFRQVSLVSAAEALTDAALPQGDADWRDRGAVLLGTMTGGAAEVERMVNATTAGSRPRVSDNLGKRPSISIQDVARAFELRGPMLGIDAACASGAAAVLHGCRLIGAGDAAWCLAGGVECSIVPSNIKLARSIGVLSTAFRDTPNLAPRPFDAQRDGYVPAEGACFLVVEDAAHAARRGARIYARIAGYADDIDTHHPTRLSSDFIERLMRRALDRAGVSASQIDWIKAHATSTTQGDAAEAQAIARMLDGAATTVSAPKSVTGHLLGAAGAMEIGFAALSLAEQVVPPTINLRTPDPACPVSCVTEASARAVQHVLANAYGFGGPGCCMVLRREGG